MEGLKNLASFKIIIVSITEKFNQITVPVKIGKHGFIDSWSLINKKKKCEWPRTRLTKICEISFLFLSFFEKKIEQDHKTIVSAPLFKSHAPEADVSESARLWSEEKSNWTGFRPYACSSSVQGWTWLQSVLEQAEKYQHHSQYRLNYSHSGRVFFPRTCRSSSDYPTFWITRSRQPREIS